MTAGARELDLERLQVRLGVRLGPDMLEFVANSPADYVARCVHWATQPQALQHLQQLRQSLRERLLESPLTDYPEFTRALENLYRQMLQRQSD